MSEHTPGPWEWDGDVWEYDRENEAPWLMSAKTGMPVIKGDIDCMRDDARLIAAAPELLEALEALVDDYMQWEMNPVSGNARNVHDLHDQARAAIAKARGKS
jgi:hypothetical protein